MRSSKTSSAALRGLIMTTPAGTVVMATDLHGGSVSELNLFSILAEEAKQQWQQVPPGSEVVYICRVRGGGAGAGFNT